MMNTKRFSKFGILAALIALAALFLMAAAPANAGGEYVHDERPHADLEWNIGETVEQFRVTREDGSVNKGHLFNEWPKVTAPEDGTYFFYATQVQVNDLPDGSGCSQLNEEGVARVGNQSYRFEDGQYANGFVQTKTFTIEVEAGDSLVPSFTWDGWPEGIGCKDNGSYTAQFDWLFIPAPPPIEPTCDRWSVTPATGFTPLWVVGSGSFSDPDGIIVDVRVEWGDGGKYSHLLDVTDLPYTYTEVGMMESKLILTTIDGREISGDACRAVVEVKEPVPGVCISNEAVIDPNTMTVTGTGHGDENTVAWQLVNLASGAIMAAGEGNAATYTFTGEFEMEYQLQFVSDAGKWSTGGCVFSFTAPAPQPGTCGLNEVLNVNHDDKTLNGRAEGIGSAWQVIELATGAVMADGNGNIAEYTFQFDYDTVYQVQYLGEDGQWSSEGCTFSVTEPEGPECTPWAYIDAHHYGEGHPGDPYGHGLVLNASAHCRQGPDVEDTHALTFDITLEVMKSGTTELANASFVEAFGFYGDGKERIEFTIEGNRATVTTKRIGQLASISYYFQWVPLEVGDFEVLATVCWVDPMTGSPMCNKGSSGPLHSDPSILEVPPADVLPPWAAVGNTVVVLNGESLEDVAARIGLPYQTLLDLNYHEVVLQDEGVRTVGLAHKVWLYEGQVLRTSWHPTFESVSVVSAEESAADPNLLAGQVIIGTAVEETTAEVAESAYTLNEDGTYTVKAGDTVSEIAAYFGLDWHYVVENNALLVEEGPGNLVILSIGQTLIITPVG